VAFAVAATGPADILTGVLTRDLTALYQYLTPTVAAFLGVGEVETAPVLRQVKAAITHYPPQRASHVGAPSTVMKLRTVTRGREPSPPQPGHRYG
jgi:hypothetical protein